MSGVMLLICCEINKNSGMQMRLVCWVLRTALNILIKYNSNKKKGKLKHIIKITGSFWETTCYHVGSSKNLLLDAKCLVTWVLHCGGRRTKQVCVKFM